MNKSSSKIKIKGILQKGLPWIVTIGILIFLFKRIPIEEVHQAITFVNLWKYVPIVILGTTIFFLWDAFVFTLLFLEFGTQVTYRGMLPIRGSSFLIWIMNYFAGMGSMAFLMNRWKKIPLSRASSVVIFSFYLDYYMIMTFCLLGVFLLPGLDLVDFFEMSEQGTFIRTIILSWLFFILLICFFHLVLPRSKGFTRIKKNEILSAFRDAPPRKYFMFMLLKILGFFICDIVFVYFTLTIFGLNVPFLKLIALFPIVRLIESIPISVMGLGTSQAATIWLITPIIESSSSQVNYEAALLAYSLLGMILVNFGRFVIGTTSVKFLPKNLWTLKKSSYN